MFPLPRSLKSERAIRAASMLLLLAGCQPAMTTNNATSSEAQELGGTRMQPPPETLQLPLRFTEHTFGAYCYNTFGCKVDYANSREAGPGEGEDPDTYRSPPPESPDYKKDWNAGYIVPRTFPPPAEVHWKSLDGVQHEAKVNIAEIFKDQLAWHKVPATDFVEDSFGGSVGIFLEVNDRVINVYTMATVPTKTEQILGNKYSYGRDDLFMVWTRTY